MPTATAYLIIGAPYVAAGAFVLALIGLIIILLIHNRVRKLRWEPGGPLEATIRSLVAHSKDMQEFRESVEDYLKKAELRMRSSLRGVGVIRFNPFHGDGSGGNQSFSAAFLNERSDGVVFSALHSRAGAASVYAKPITKGASTFELTEEERDAIGKAMESLRLPLSAGSKN